MNDLSMDVSQTAIESIISPSEFCVIDSQKFHHGCMNIVDGCWMVTVQWLIAPLIAFPIGASAFHTTATEPVGKDKRIMVPSPALLRITKTLNINSLGLNGFTT